MADSNFSETFGLAGKSLTDYTDSVLSFLSGTSPMPAIPSQLSDQVSKMAGSMGVYSSYQATIAEAQMNRQIEGLRGVSRSITVASLTRGDFYAAAISSLDTRNTDAVSDIVVQKAIMDARHPNQTGTITT